MFVEGVPSSTVASVRAIEVKMTTAVASGSSCQDVSCNHSGKV